MYVQKFIVSTLCVAVLLGGVALPAPVAAQSAPDRSAMLAQIEQLMKLIVTLQAQLKTAQGDLSDAIKAGLEEGMEDDDIKKVQELLASDPALYPNGQVTGYFGPMTREALKRFQGRYGLEVTGKLDEATREAIKELRKERIQGRIPPGLLQSQAARERVRDKLKEKWGDCDFTRPLREQKCERVKDRRDDDSDNDDVEDEDDDSLTDGQKARLAIARAEARLKALERILDRRDYDRTISSILINKAQERLREARAKLRAASIALATDPAEAEELAEDAEELVEEGAEAVDEEEVVDEAGDEVMEESEDDEDDEDDNDEEDDEDDDEEDDEDEDE